VFQRLAVQFARRGIPQTQHVIGAAGGRPFAIGAERDAMHRVRMHERRPERLDDLARRRLAREEHANSGEAERRGEQLHEDD